MKMANQFISQQKMLTQTFLILCCCLRVPVSDPVYLLEVLFYQEVPVSHTGHCLAGLYVTGLYVTLFIKMETLGCSYFMI